MKIAAITALGVCLSAMAAAQSVRDAGRPAPPPTAAPAGTASIGGVITDVGNAPARRVRVSLTSGDSGSLLTAMTTETGAFEFANLRAGRYTLSAQKPAYLDAVYGAKRPGRPGTSIVLAAGQRLGGIAMKIVRGGVITGRVTDDRGEPLDGAQVRALRLAPGPGGRTLTSPGALPGSIRTDDHGSYRFFGLDAGDYVIAVTPPSLGAADVRLMTETDFDVSASDSLARSASSAGVLSVSPVTADQGPRASFVPVFFPGTTVVANAGAIAVGPGEERGGIDIPVAFVRTAIVSGVVSNTDASMRGPIALSLVPLGPIADPGAAPARSAVANAPDWKFTLSAVPPGRYVITAASRRTSPTDLGIWAKTDVTVAGNDLSGVVVPVQPGLSLAGHVTFETSGAPPDAARVRLGMTSLDANPAIRVSPMGMVDAEGRFLLAPLVPGPYRLTATVAPAGDQSTVWSIKSLIVNGRDVSDTGLDVTGRITDAQVTLTDRSSEISGTFSAASGQPAPDYTVVLFGIDRAVWMWQSRRILTTRPATNGQFSFRGLPPGDYYMAAVDDVEPNAWFDAAFLDGLVPASVRVSAVAGERRVQDIRVAR